MRYDSNGNAIHPVTGEPFANASVHRKWLEQRTSAFWYAYGRIDAGERTLFGPDEFGEAWADWYLAYDLELTFHAPGMLNSWADMCALGKVSRCDHVGGKVCTAALLDLSTGLPV